MEMTVTFPGGARVDASYGNHIVRTDQRLADGGEDSAPTPFSLFLVSLGTCAGIYVLEFLRKRNLPTDNVKLIQQTRRDPESGMLGRVEIEIMLPPDFPEKYREAIVRAAELCSVAKLLQKPPAILVSARQG